MPGKSHGWRSLVGCSPWGPEESDTTERLHFHFSLSSIGEGNGNPLQCSCLENPRDRGAWWAAVSGIAQSRTPLKRLSSSSSNTYIQNLERCYWRIYLQGSNGETDIENRLLDTGGGRGNGCTYGWFLEKAMAPHSSTLSWKIPWTEEPGRL